MSASCNTTVPAECVESIDLLIVSTVSSRTRRKTQGRAVAGASVVTRVPLRLRLKLPLLFTKFIALALQTYRLVEQCLESGSWGMYDSAVDS